jgi:hypothetical protein
VEFPQIQVVNQAAEDDKTSHGVFPRPCQGARFHGAFTGDVIPGSFPAVLRTDINTLGCPYTLRCDFLWR